VIELKAGGRDAARTEELLLHVDRAVHRDGKLSISGWALARQGIQRVDIFGPSGFLGSTTCVVQRLDVVAKYPNIATSDEAGFEFEAPVPAGFAAAGGYLMLVRAHGRRGEFAERSIEAKADRPAAEPAKEARIRLCIDAPESFGGVAVAPVHHQLSVRGWALARSGIDRIEVRLDGALLGNAYFGSRRSDVEKAFPDWPDALLSGFGFTIPSRALKDGKRQLEVIAYDREGAAAPVSIGLAVQKSDLDDRLARLTTKVPLAETRTRLAGLPRDFREMTFVVLVPVGDRWSAQAEATLESVLRQDFDHWRLILVSPSAALRASIARDQLASLPSALRERCSCASPGSLTWRTVTGKAKRAAVSVMLPGDAYGADAFTRFVQECARGAAAPDLVYADERVPGADGHFRAFFKPGWSPDTLLSTNYLGAGWIADPALAGSAFSTPAEFLAASRYERALRLAERAARVESVAAVLVERGTHADSSRDEKNALKEALRRLGEKSRVVETDLPNIYRVQRTVANAGMVSIIIPTIAANGLVKTCIESIRKKSTYRNFEIVLVDNIRGSNRKWKKWFAENADRVVAVDEPFNWSRLNNAGRNVARGDYLLFLNDDVEVLDPSWLEALLEHAQRSSVGAVGPKLLYPDGKVQHAGQFLARDGIARHAFRFAGGDDGAYFGFAMMQRNVSSVTGACMMVRTEVFDILGGFDEAHEVVNNDVDFCLRCHSAGLSVVFTPYARLIHHELASRAALQDTYDTSAFLAKWGELFAKGDPYFNRNLSLDSDDYVAETEPVDEVYAGYPLFAREGVRKILVVKLDHIGDFVTALPAIQQLKADFPDAEVSALTGPSVAPLARSQNIISHVHELSFFHARSGLGFAEVTESDLQALHAKLSRERFDLAVDLRKLLDTRHVLKYTGARFLAGFDRNNACPWLDIALEWDEDSAFHQKRSHVSGDLLNLAAAVSNAAFESRRTLRIPDRLPAMPAALAKIAKKLFARPVVCVHPASGNELRQWPAANFSLLIDLLVSELGVHVLVIGGPDEVGLAERVLDGVRTSTGVWSLVGGCKLSELPGVLVRASLFVGNNSGPKHLAAGLGVPTVAVHSNVVSSEEWGPLGERAVALRRDTECGPCYISNIEECRRKLACLTGITPRAVLDVCRRFLGPR
jgi:ADP-heptose:LPS heptosyltransferase/GT2 family glycosyltransferase